MRKRNALGAFVVISTVVCGSFSAADTSTPNTDGIIWMDTGEGAGVKAPRDSIIWMDGMDGGAVRNENGRTNDGSKRGFTSTSGIIWMDAGEGSSVKQDK